MSNKHGDFIWYELLTHDLDAAQAFYVSILGWQVMDSGQEDRDYRILQMTDSNTGEVHGLGGMMAYTREASEAQQPVWLGYVGVDDVDDYTARIAQAGGEILMRPFDVPRVGRIAMVTDPQGAPFYIMRGMSEADSTAFAYDSPRVGHCAWNELSTTSPEAALDFYSQQFGWVKDGEMDMGAMGVYGFLRHGSVFGAMMRLPDAVVKPLWTYYFRVQDIDVAINKVNAGGGHIEVGPDEIPTGEFMIKGTDPQGALFALVGHRNSEDQG